ncbi:MAG: hypothetical protein U1F43_32080 [Myxococcota bacterium]
MPRSSFLRSSFLRSSVLRSSLLALAASASVTACGTAPVASRFDVPAPPDALVDEVQQAIVADGLEVASVDARLGVVRSVWTTIPDGNVSTATHRRYTVLLKASQAGTQALVRGEFKSCTYTAPPGSVQTTTQCQSTGYRSGICQTTEQQSEVVCEPVDAIFPDDQQDLDAFAAHVREALGVAPAPAPATTSATSAR